MIHLQCSGHSFAYEVECVARLFFPGEKILKTADCVDGDSIRTSITETAGGVEVSVSVYLDKPACNSRKHRVLPDGAGDKAREEALATLLFHILCQATGTRPPWGILTGVRPVRLCRQMEAAGMDEAAVRRRLTEDYLVLPQKMDLTLATKRVQAPILAADKPERFSLYINIPFCPTRCLYCSFISAATAQTARLIPRYVELLEEELRLTGEIAARKGLVLDTVYMGGGTPTTLEPAQLEAVLSAVERHFNLSRLREYTVEAGRADTITAEKLAVLRNFGIGRISINPQTMDDTTLQAIGRGHTVRQVLDSYETARSMGFSAINMDLIAGLLGEGREQFANTVSQVLALRPENITLHTLTVKRSSHLREREDAFAGSRLPLDDMLSGAQERFGEAGYRPYYLYRQKGTVQNLENTGFSLPGQEGIYNVYSMEETHTILAVGAGGVTKLCGHNGSIQRVFNYKYPFEYVHRFEDIQSRKTAIEKWSSL